MSGFTQITRMARRWRADRNRATMEGIMFSLPPKLQKDVGWPGPEDSHPSGVARSDVYARRSQ